MKKFKKFFFSNSLTICLIFFGSMLILVFSINECNFPWYSKPPIVIYLFWLSAGMTLGGYWVSEAVTNLNKPHNKK